MTTTRWFMAALALAAAPVSAQTRPPAAQPQPPAAQARPPVIQAQDRFFMPGPPETVAGSMVEKAEWSPDGRYALVVRQRITMRSMTDASMEPSLVLWNASTRTSTVVWRVQSQDYHIADATWMPGTSVAFIPVMEAKEGQEPRMTIWRIDARRATATEVQDLPAYATLAVSPRLPVAAIIAHDEQGAFVRSLDPAGTLGAPVRLSGVQEFADGWSADGGTLYLRQLVKPQEDAPKPEPTWTAYKATTGAISTTTLPPPTREEPTAPKRAFRLEQTEIPLGAAARAETPSPWGDNKVRPLWLVQGEGKDATKLLLAADAEKYDVSPKGDAVLYTNREGAFAIPLMVVSRTAMEQARQAAQRSQLLSNGKQIALALIMYAADNEDVLPPGGTDLPDTLGPYVKSDQIWRGLGGEPNAFVYTLPGGPMSSISDPANTEMGYILGPGGRAVVYADGHVRWIPVGSENGGS